MAGNDAVDETVTLDVCVGMNHCGEFTTSGRASPVVW